VIAANGRSVSLYLPADRWLSSEISVGDSLWRDQFLRLVSRSSSGPATIFPIWRSSPCKQIDWSRPIDIRWTDEQRAHVSAFLRDLPAQR
jgi:hypothetical protein